MDFRHIIEATGEIVDIAGVAVMVIGALVSIPLALRGHQARRLPAGSPKMEPTVLTGECWADPFCWDWSCWSRQTSSAQSR